MKNDVASEALKSAPAVTVTAAAAAGAWTLNDWVALTTIVYVVLQGGYLLWRWFNEWRNRGSK